MGEGRVGVELPPARCRLRRPPLPNPSPSRGGVNRMSAVTLILAAERDAVQLHPVIDEPEAELLGDPALERFELLVDEFDDVPRLDVDQMVVMRFRRRLVA